MGVSIPGDECDLPVDAAENEARWNDETHFARREATCCAEGHQLRCRRHIEQTAMQVPISPRIVGSGTLAWTAASEPAPTD